MYFGKAVGDNFFCTLKLIHHLDVRFLRLNPADILSRELTMIRKDHQSKAGKLIYAITCKPLQTRRPPHSSLRARGSTADPPVMSWS